MSSAAIRIASIALLVFGLAGVCSDAGAIEREWRGVRLGPDAELWQARSCYGEVGPSDLEVCTAMAFVHLRRMELPAWRGRTLVEMIRAYSSPVKGRGPRSWVMMLHPTRPRPRAWPRRMPYERTHPA